MLVGATRRNKEMPLTINPEIEIKLAIISILSGTLKKGGLTSTEYFDLCECMYQWTIKNKNTNNLRSVN